MTELTFLIELLLNHDLPKETKALIAERIKDVETNLVLQPSRTQPMHRPLPPLVHSGQVPPILSDPPPVPIDAIAQTPQAAMAMAQRNQAIENARNEKDKGIYRPRVR